MKKNLSMLVVSILLILGIIRTDSAGLWSKYVAADKSYSFHYPSGWKVKPEESMLVVENPPTDEELLMAGVPFDRSKSPADLAAGFIALLRENKLDIQAFNWQSDPETADTQVVFQLAGLSDGKQYMGMGIVFKAEKQATWFSYTAPAAGYSGARGLGILQGFMGSLTSGNNSKAPLIDYTKNSTEKIESNAQAFMFVLEFALGAPLQKAKNG